MNQANIDFIQYVLDRDRILPDTFGRIDWQDFMEFCHRHSILGIVFDGMERSGQRVPRQVLFEWISYVENIKRHNKVINDRLVSIVNWFRVKGFRSVILKGQANALMYPKPELRSPGDIDIWVDANRNDIIRMVIKDYPRAHYSLHHIKMPVFSDVSVEVHYSPIYLIDRLADKRLQHHISSIAEGQFQNQEMLDGVNIGCLTDEFNVVYQLLHMYAHLFSTRNNFKQFVDYYYLLKKGFTNAQKRQIVALMKEFKVLEYAKGMMWVMRNVLGLGGTYLITEPDEKTGKAILRESMHYGTFSKNKIIYVVERFTANVRLMRLFPSQVLLSPLFLIWHQWWKLKMKFEIGLAR